MAEEEKVLTAEEIEARTAAKLKADEEEHEKVRDAHDAERAKREAEDKAERQKEKAEKDKAEKDKDAVAKPAVHARNK